MDSIQKEQKKGVYVTSNISFNDYFKLFNSVLYGKVNNHEERITDLESRLKSLREWSTPNNYTTNDNQLYANRQNKKLADYAKRREKEKSTEGILETITAQLSAVEDKKLQIQIVGELVDEIRKILKEIPKQKNNYRRKLLLMFHEALKQNYTKHLFNKSQVKALSEIARVCNEAFVTKEQYFKMDNILCDCDLDMMPNLE